MINLRYHIVSITAVFLALAIGVVMGTSFLSRATVDQLNDRIVRAENGIRATRIRNEQLQAALDQRETEDRDLAAAGDQLFEARLAGVPTLVLAAAGVDQPSLDRLRGALTASAADFKGTLVLTDRMRLDGDDANQMAALLNTPTTDRAQIRRTLVTEVGAMLDAAGTEATTPATTPSSTTPPTLPGSQEPPLLTGLRDGGWMTYQAPPDIPADLPLLTTGGYRYIIVSGTNATLPDRDFVLPLLRSMARTAPAPVVVASAATGQNPERTRSDVVAPIRGDEVLRRNVSTVDDLELFSGVAAVVLAVEDLSTTRRGHYGVGDGVTSLLPPPT